MRVVPVVAGYVWRVLRESGLAPLSIAVQNGTSLMTIRHHIDDVFLPGLEQSGQPIPMLASSGRPLSSLAQSGRPLSVGMEPGASYRSASMHGVLAQAERLAYGIHTAFLARASAEALFRMGRIPEARAVLEALRHAQEQHGD